MAEMSKLEKSVEIAQTLGLAALAFLGGRSHGQSSLSSGAEKGAEALKANVFGFGYKDEAFFTDAVALGHKKGEISNRGVERLSVMFKKLHHFERAKLGKLVGIDEQDVSAQTLARNDDGTPALDKKGQPIYNKESFRGNVRGMRLLVMLSKMTTEKSVNFLRNSGVLDGPIDDMGEVWKQIKRFLRRKATRDFYAEVKADASALIAAIDGHVEQATLRYLGAANRAHAEVIVRGRERAVAEHRAQSWYQRDLKDRPWLLRTWGLMVGIIILAIAYVFIGHGGPTN